MASVVRRVFEDSSNYMKSGTLIRSVIEKFDQSINLEEFTTRQHLGDIYEQLLNDLRAAGNAGEFYTPRPITQLMIQLVNPSLVEREVTMDPACGTGGFLTATLDHLRGQVTDVRSYLGENAPDATASRRREEAVAASPVYDKSTSPWCASSQSNPARKHACPALVLVARE